MGWNPFKKSSWKQVGDAIVDTGKKAGDTIVDTANQVAKGSEQAYNATKDFAISLEKDTTKAVQHTTSVVAKNTEEYAKQGFDVTNKAWKDGSSQVIKYAGEGVEYVEFAATEAYKWADSNACYLGLNLALTTGCVLYFTPKPDPAEPGTVTSTAISSTYLGYIAVQGSNTAMAMAVGEIITKSILLIPGIKGNCDEKMLNRVIVNSIATCNPAVLAVSLATPAGVGIFIGSVISPIVAQLVCDKTAPKGLTKAVS